MSNIAKEFESRIMLTNDEYISVVSFFMKLYPNQHFLQNTNYYFDTDDFYLKNQHITLRVRFINDVKCELTLKIKGSNGDQEINDSLTFKQFELLKNEGVFPIGNVRDYLLTHSLPLNAYKCLTSLYNLRLEIKQEDHLLVIDKNIYNDITDYNLEIETEDNVVHAQDVLSSYIKQFNLSLGAQKYKGKAHRALASLN